MRGEEKKNLIILLPESYVFTHNFNFLSSLLNEHNTLFGGARFHYLFFK